MECYSCDSTATQQCPRCARVYCDAHGGEFCAECLSPASAVPSFNLYRGSLLALLVGAAVALWLLVQPPGSGDSQEVVLVLTPTVPIPATVTATPRPPVPTLTPTTPPTPTVEVTQTPTPEPRTYQVQSGDSLLSIAQRLAPPGVSSVEYAAQIAAANGISTDATIRPGDILVLP